MARRVSRMFAVGAWVTLPLAIFAGCDWLRLVNPMECAFDNSFAIQNDTASTIWVSPIGHFPAESVRRLIPQRLVPGLGLPPLGDSRRVGPGEHVTITYDADDIVLSELVVRTDSLVRPRVVATTAEYRNGGTVVVGDLTSLPEAAPLHLDGASSYSSWREWLLLLLFVVPLGFWTGSRVLGRRELVPGTTAR